MDQRLYLGLALSGRIFTCLIGLGFEWFKPNCPKNKK
jgi:hypothetical protein